MRGVVDVRRDGCPYRTRINERQPEESGHGMRQSFALLPASLKGLEGSWLFSGAGENFLLDPGRFGTHMRPSKRVATSLDSRALCR